MATSRTLPTVQGYVSRLRAFSTSDVADALVQLGVKRGGYLNGLQAKAPASGPPQKICGPVVTVRMCTYGGGRGEKLRPLVEYNEPGKIMLIETPDGKAAKISACWGPLESARAKALQAEGVIVSGNVRQLSQCQEVGLPLFYRGTAPLGPRQYMRLAKVNEPIHIGGTDIFADNIILADEDGVVVVHPRLIAEVLSACDKAAKRQAVLRRAIDEGKSMEVAQVEEHDFLAGLKKAESLFKW